MTKIPFGNATDQPIALFRDNNYEIGAAVGLTASDMKPTANVLDTGTGPNLINLRFLPAVWCKRIEPVSVGGLMAASRQPIPVAGVLQLCVQLGDLRVRTWFWSHRPSGHQRSPCNVLHQPPRRCRFPRSDESCRATRAQSQFCPSAIKNIPLSRTYPEYCHLHGAPPSNRKDSPEAVLSIFVERLSRIRTVYTARGQELPRFSQAQVLVDCGTPGIIVESLPRLSELHLAVPENGIMDNLP